MRIALKTIFCVEVTKQGIGPFSQTSKSLLGYPHVCVRLTRRVYGRGEGARLVRGDKSCMIAPNPKAVVAADTTTANALFRS